MDDANREIERFLKGDKGTLLRKNEFDALQEYLKNTLAPEHYQELLQLNIQVMEVELTLEF